MSSCSSRPVPFRVAHWWRQQCRTSLWPLFDWLAQRCQLFSSWTNCDRWSSYCHMHWHMVCNCCWHRVHNCGTGLTWCCFSSATLKLKTKIAKKQPKVLRLTKLNKSFFLSSQITMWWQSILIVSHCERYYSTVCNARQTLHDATKRNKNWLGKFSELTNRTVEFVCHFIYVHKIRCGNTKLLRIVFFFIIRCWRRCVHWELIHYYSTHTHTHTQKKTSQCILNICIYRIYAKLSSRMHVHLMCQQVQIWAKN